MPKGAQLRERAKKLEEREDHVERLIRQGAVDLEKIRDEIDQEREERDQYEVRRKELGEELEEEAERDAVDRGLLSEAKEAYKEARRDELADFIESSEARLDRLVAKAAQERKAIDELRKKDARIEERVKRVLDKLERIKKDKKGRLTKDFHVAEFDCRDGTKVPDYMVPHLKELCQRHLQPLRNAGGLVSINSGYRHARYNASIGGASQSYHVYEIRKASPAADHIQAGRPAPAVQKWHESSSHPFDGMGFYTGFTHGDDRGYRSRWYGAS